MSTTKAPPYPIRSSGPKPLHFRGLTLGRLDHFENGPYANINAVLEEHRTDSAEFVQISSWSSPGRDKTPFKEAVRQKFKPAKKGDSFGPSWTHHWFRITLTIPESWREAERIQLEWDPSCEAMVFDGEGLPLQGITGGFGGDRRVDFILDPKSRDSTYRFFIETACNGMFGNGVPDNNDPPDQNRYFTLASADIVVPRMEAYRLLWDFRTIKDLALHLPESSPLGTKCMEVGNTIMNTFKSTDLSTIAHSRCLAEKVLGQNWEQEGAGIFKGGIEEEGTTTLGVGNCHIDTAWLWPFSATRSKTARSWSSQIDLMRRYPEYRFVASQAQQFDWLEQDYPSLFQEIRGKVEEGQFQPIGGAWVECDTNMPSGEALCRQFLFGQRYFKSRFGSYCNTFWLPDSFGYSSQLPQLCRLAGLDFFFTQKLSWSQFNAPVHTSFNWVGQDGSQVVTHMTPVNTYTAQASVEDVIRSLANHKSLQSGAATSLLAFGNGDGGGGPLAVMLESLRRCRAVSDHSGELPKVTMGQSVDDFYEDILKKTDGGKTLPTWNGELYLELHRGTLTSHGSIKKGNRKSEILLREIEYVATLASLDQGRKYSYPKDGLDPLWQGVLLNQFHDVLPGSAIGMVYVDAEKIYADVATKGSALLEEALSSLIPHSTSVYSPNATGDDLVAINTSSYPRREVIKIPLEAARGLAEAAVQVTSGGAYVLFDNQKGEMVSRAVSASALGGRSDARARKEGDEFLLSNETVTVRVSKQGRIMSLVDNATGRELTDEGKTAGFVLFEDRPLNWDAWDVDAFHLETKSEVNAASVKITEDGPLRATLCATYIVGKSEVKAFISLDMLPVIVHADALSHVRFDVEVDWKEKHQFLKWEIPLAIASDFATYENQFGCCQRPTMRNTTWDRAKFEVCGHRWADLSEFGYGVAVINDCKYGYACEGNVLRLSLLRSSTSPDADQDTGFHTFSFAIAPHRGSFTESYVPITARLFNSPPHVRRIDGQAKKQLSTASATFELAGDRNIVLDTVKRGEDDHFKEGRQTVVLRIYEAYGGHGTAVLRIRTTRDVEKVSICDILERDLETLSVKDVEAGVKEVRVKMRGFQVLTLKVTVR